MIEFKRGNCGVIWGFENGKPTGRIYTMEDSFFEAEGRLGSYEKISTGIYGCCLERREVVFDGRHPFSCFFIVCHPATRKKIREVLDMLFIPGYCRNFHFFGEKEALWHFETDLFDAEMHQHDNRRRALTIGWDHLEEMIDWMTEKELCLLPPHDCYLIYDDEELYTIAKEMIAERIQKKYEAGKR